MDYAKIAKDLENRKRMGIAPEPIDDLEVDRSDDPLCQIEEKRMRDAAIAEQEMDVSSLLRPRRELVAEDVGVPALARCGGYDQYVLVHGCFLSQICLMTFAGTPATTVLGGTSFVTTAPAPTIAPSPIVTPGQIVTRVPSQTLLPIFTGFANMPPRLSGSGLWLSVAMIVCGPISTSSPMLIPP